MLSPPQEDSHRHEPDTLAHYRCRRTSTQAFMELGVRKHIMIDFIECSEHVSREQKTNR